MSSPDSTGDGTTAGSNSGAPDAAVSGGPSEEPLPAAEDPHRTTAGMGGPPAGTAPPIPEVPHAGIRYAVLRLTMFITVGGVLYLFGMRGWPLLFVAVLVSGVLSFFVFLRQREAAARNLEAMIEGRRARHVDADPGSGEPGASTPER